MEKTAHKFSILYVDDEESNLRIFKDTFRRDYQVFTANSARKGIEILDNQEIDLILSDQRMPEMSGIEFLQYSLGKNPKPGRILITGYTDFNALEAAINNARIFQYVQKPWTKERLQEVIENALESYLLKEQNEELTNELQQSNQELERVNDQLKKEIEHQKETEQNLISANEQLIISKEAAEESNRLKTEFLRNMSHEIRTPIHGIIGFSELLDNSQLTDEQRKTYSNYIIDSSMQLLRIIDDILEISSLETKQICLTKTEVSLSDLLSEIVNNYAERAYKNNTQLRIAEEIASQTCHILTDIDKLKKIIGNLIENAVKFTHSGMIEINCQRTDHLIKICIKDNGIGISPEKWGIIFHRFTQESDEIAQNYGGLGLGLAIAQENALLLNGNITLTSEKGKGSEFTLSIPYEAVPEKEKKQKIDKKDDTREPFIILIAEDEIINYMYLEILLKTSQWNLTILHAKNGREATEICRSNPNISLVLMDLKMPVLNGFEATRQIKQLRPKLPIIAQTAYTTPEDKQKAREAGCDFFISKPINKEMLFTTINDLIV